MTDILEIKGHLLLDESSLTSVFAMLQKIFWKNIYSKVLSKCEVDLYNLNNTMLAAVFAI